MACSVTNMYAFIPYCDRNNMRVSSIYIYIIISNLSAIFMHARKYTLRDWRVSFNIWVAGVNLLLRFLVVTFVLCFTERTYCTLMCLCRNWAMKRLNNKKLTAWLISGVSKGQTGLPFFFLPETSLAFGYCRCLRLSVWLCAHECVCICLRLWPHQRVGKFHWKLVLP